MTFRDWWAAYKQAGNPCGMIPDAQEIALAAWNAARLDLLENMEARGELPSGRNA